MSKLLKMEHIRLRKELKRLEKEEIKLDDQREKIESYDEIIKGLMNEIAEIVAEKEKELYGNLPDTANKFVSENEKTNDKPLSKNELYCCEQLLTEEWYVNKIKFIVNQMKLYNNMIADYKNKMKNYNKKAIKMREKADRLIEKIVNTVPSEFEKYMIEKIFEVVKRYDLLKDYYWDRDKRNEIKKYVLTEGEFMVFTEEEYMVIEREIIK